MEMEATCLYKILSMYPLFKSETHLMVNYDESLKSNINPLTPDLNAPVQQCPAEVFKYGFLFVTLTLRKKSHISYTFASNFRK
jgi:hypothetical protein